jgi:hypothetical protein
MSAEVKPFNKFAGAHETVSVLQDRLWSVLQEPQFDDMSAAELVGTLEYLKWNIINRSDS